MTWLSLKNWLRASPIRRAETPDPFYAERMQLQAQVNALQGELSKAWSMVREASENERLAYQSMCNTLGRSQFSAPPFPNAGLPPASSDEPLIIDSNFVNGSDEVERMNRTARADARAALSAYMARNRGNSNPNN